MNDVVISARGLGKSYQIGHKIDRSVTFREQLVAAGSALRRNFGRTLRGEQILAGEEVETFWALKDVDFDIRRGDVVGVIGRNGAGKSTLLKVLSRITEPTTGRVEIRGRVASLLEVGTGFHPELTGRENIFLNGAILGMTRAEIRKKFDEIVDFAGVEKFIDTPVKRYSSGMYVRLAFSVAAHLEPEILIVDEVLAVGDAEFQKKCLGKMQDVAGQGRTVLFVSHNLTAIRRMCKSGILLSSGNVCSLGELEQVLEDYSRERDPKSHTEIAERLDRTGNGRARVVAVNVQNGANEVAVGEKVVFRLKLQTYHHDERLRPWLLIRNSNEEDVLMVMPLAEDAVPVSDTIELSCDFECILSPGRYSIACGILDSAGRVADWLDDVEQIFVHPTFSNGRPYDQRLGMVTFSSAWRRAAQIESNDSVNARISIASNAKS